MGQVYKAKNLFFDRHEALKIIGKSNDLREYRDAFQTEMRLHSRLDHANIVEVHYAGEWDGELYFTMEYFDRGDLQRDIDRRRAGGRPYDSAEAARLVKDVAKAVAYAHSFPADQKVIHRDIKPSNVLLADDGTPKLADFGLAFLRGHLDLRQAGQTVGTPGFMPPEQAAGSVAEMDERSDVYGLGALLYYVLTGRPPFEVRSPDGEFDYEATLELVKSGKPPRAPSATDPGVAPRLEDICLKCLRQKPADRYQSAAQVYDALRAFLRPPWRRRHGRMAVLVTLFVVLAGTTAWSYARPRLDAAEHRRRGDEKVAAVAAVLRHPDRLSDADFKSAADELAAARSEYEAAGLVLDPARRRAKLDAVEDGEWEVKRAEADDLVRRRQKAQAAGYAATAEESYTKARGLYFGLRERPGSAAGVRVKLAGVFTELGRLDIDARKYVKAMGELRNAEAVLLGMTEADRAGPDYLLALAETHHVLGACHGTKEHWAEARKCHESDATPG